MRIFSILILFISLASCEQSSNVTEIQGEWRSQCESIIGTSNEMISIHKVLIFSSNTSSHHINEYSDVNCTVFNKKITTLGADEISGSEGVNGTYTIGQKMVTSNGVDATHLNYITTRGREFGDIYLLQNNNTTLFLGEKCPTNDLSCTHVRPDRLNYNKPFTKK